MVDTALDFPIYSIKAVAHMAGITEPTLRAWEKRYSILSPQRTDSNHRRYTKRDIYRVIWLRHRLEEGMSISQASTLLETQSEESILEGIQNEIKPGRTVTTNNTANKRNGNGRAAKQHDVRSVAALSEELLESFLDFDEQRADNLLSEAVGLYSPEQVCMEIMKPVLEEIGERWMANEVTVANEHFASNICRTWLNGMMNSLPVVESGPMIVTACGPHEFHELGVITTSYFLRRRGWRVIYLGQNVPALDLEKDLRRLKPSLVVFSAGRSDSAVLLAHEILPVIKRLREEWLPGLLFAYAGAAFQNEPSLHELFPGEIYFGDDSRNSVAIVEQLLNKSN